MTATLHRVLARVRALFTGRQLDRDLDDEVSLQIQLRAEALERAACRATPLSARPALSSTAPSSAKRTGVEQACPLLKAVVRHPRLAGPHAATPALRPSRCK